MDSNCSMSALLSLNNQKRRQSGRGANSTSGRWKFGAPEGIRTPDPQIRSLVLYPAELPALAPDPSRKAGRPRCYRCGDEPASDYKLVHPKPH